VGQSAAATLTIMNSGNSTLTVSGMTVPGGSAYSASFTSGTIPAGGSQQVVIQFAPTVAQGYSGTLTVNGNQTSGTNTIAISGTGMSTPTPTPSTAFHVWGGGNYTQYLGFFTCVFCQEFSSDSINNEFGKYGSQFSTTSIRNDFSPYGSKLSTLSACNEFASNPPRVYNPNGTVYYGELTVNQFRREAITTTSIVNWLVGDVCRH